MRKLIAAAVPAVLAAALAVPALGSTPSRTVKIGDDFFSPASLKIKHGTKVVWKWTGSNDHNVTWVSGPSEKFHSPDQSSGTYRHTFKKNGTYKLMCTIHGFTMKVKVT
jgi:plastocyanin